MSTMDELRRLQADALIEHGPQIGTGGIPGMRAFESVPLCSGCSHIPHDPNRCGGHSVILSDSRCGCTFSRTQTYEKTVR